VAQIGYDDGGFFNSTSPSATVVTLGNYGDTNGSGTMIAYCLHSVTGFSKIGSYTGNGNSDGTFVYTGFRPAWLMTRQIAGTNGWFMVDDKRDPMNPAGTDYLFASETDASTTTNDKLIDLVSNGFKARESTGYFNDDGVQYLYIAFASAPLKYTLAR